MNIGRAFGKFDMIADKYQSVIFLLLFSLTWVRPTILSYARGFIDGIPFFAVVFDVLYALTVFALFAMLYRRIQKRLSVGAIGFVLSMFLALLLSVIFSKAKYAAEYVGPFLVEILPFFFIGLCMPYKKEERHAFYKTVFLLSVISAIASFLYMIYFRATGRTFSGPNNMDLSYKNLLPILYVTWYSLKTHSYVGYAAMAMGYIFLFSMGTRGALLVTGIWFIICFVSMGKYRKEKLIVVGGLMAVLALLFITGWIRGIAQVMKDLFDMMGLNSRIFEFILESNIADNNGRTPLWNAAQEAIAAQGILPGGLMYDRVVLNDSYVHNLFLEMFLDYGVLLGTVLAIALILLCVYTVLHTKGHSRVFFLMFCCCFGIKLMLSSSYLQEPYFFFMLGMAFTYSRAGIKKGELYKNVTFASIGALLQSKAPWKKSQN